jgi:hypothetical protein
MDFGPGLGRKVVEVLSSLYLGFASTFWGGVIGGLWGFADAFLAGLLFALLYNAFAGRKLAERTSILGRIEQPAH